MLARRHQPVMERGISLVQMLNKGAIQTDQTAACIEFLKGEAETRLKRARH
jgi:hypothetical protein